MALDKFYWRVEGTTLDATHDFSAGDTTAVLASTAAINVDGALVGTNGLDCPSAGDYAEFAVSAGDIVSPTEGAIAFKFRIVAHAANQSLFRAFNSAAINNHIKILSIGTDDATGRELQLHIRRAGGANVTLSTTAADLALNTEYAVVARYHETNGDMRLEVYNADNTLRTSVENLASGFASPTGINSLFFGVSEGIGSPDYHVDNLMISGTYGEPLENNLDINSYTAYGGAGTIYTKTLSDTIVVADGQFISRERTVIKLDEVAVTDGQFISRERGRVLDDGATITDQTLVTRYVNRVMSDFVTVLDTFIKQISGMGIIHTITLSDVIAVTDGLLAYRQRNRIFSDAITLSDGTIVTRERLRHLSDSLSITDQQLHSIQRTVIASEQISVTDNMLSFRLRYRNMVDAVALSDDFLKSITGVAPTITVEVRVRLGATSGPRLGMHDPIRLGADEPPKLGGYN